MKCMIGIHEWWTFFKIFYKKNKKVSYKNLIMIKMNWCEKCKK